MKTTDAATPEVPELPECALRQFAWLGDAKPREYYTADQMREYALSAIAALASQKGADTPAAPDDLNSIERYRMQMAGISTASFGYWKEGDSIHPDYDTVALRDVAKLYAKYDELYKQVHSTAATPAARVPEGLIVKRLARNRYDIKFPDDARFTVNVMPGDDLFGRLLDLLAGPTMSAAPDQTDGGKP